MNEREGHEVRTGGGAWLWVAMVIGAGAVLAIALWISTPS